MPTSIREAINRGNNLLMVAFAAILAFGAIPLGFFEHETLDIVEDAFFCLLGIAAVAWYLRGRNRYHFSWMPYILLCLGLATKILALFIELSRPGAAEDELTFLTLLVMVLAVSTFQMFRARRANQALRVIGPTGAAIPQTGQAREK